jgi:O-antigen/teichoic acid export membrane protein
LNRVQQSPIGKRIISGTFWSVLGNGFGKMFTFVAMVLVARILGKEAFGEFGLVRSTAMTFVAFSSFGIGITATKYIAELLHTDKERAGRIVGLSYIFTIISSFIIAVLFYVLSPWICEIWLKVPHLTNAMRLGSLLLFLITFMGTQISVMTGFQNFRGLAFATGIVGILSLPIYIIGTYWYGMFGAITALVLCAAINITTNSLFIYQNTKKYQIQYSFASAYKEWSILCNSNLPIVICGILYSGMIWLVQMMLRIQHNGAAELGVFYAAQNIQVAFFFLPSILTTVFFPNLCEIGGTGNNSRYWVIVKKGLGLQTAISLILALPMILFPNFLMKLYGNEFINNNLIIVAFGILGIVNVLCVTLYQVMVDQKKLWFCCFATILELIIVFLVVHYHIMQNHFDGIGILTALITGRVIWLFSGLSHLYLRS